MPSTHRNWPSVDCSCRSVAICSTGPRKRRSSGREFKEVPEEEEEEEARESFRFDQNFYVTSRCHINQ